MKLDQEIEIMSRSYDLLSGLDNEAKVRVLLWLSNKFRLGQTSVMLMSDVVTSGAVVTEEPTDSTPTKPAPVEAPSGLDSFNSFDELYRFLRPSSDAEKALLAAVFLSARRNMPEISSAQVQKELKNIGERVSNITQAISALVKKKLVHQLGKEGNSQQARKKYRVTPEAVRTVGELLKKR